MASAVVPGVVESSCALTVVVVCSTHVQYSGDLHILYLCVCVCVCACVCV